MKMSTKIGQFLINPFKKCQQKYIHLKMLYAYVICCIYLLTPFTNVCEEANVVGPEHQSGLHCLTKTLLKDFSSRL